MKNNKGFTLIELIASIGLMILIATIVTVNLNHMKEKREQSKITEFKTKVQDAACVFIDLTVNKVKKSNCYPNCTVSVDDLIKDGMISDDLINPKTNQAINPSLQISVSWDSNGKKTCTLSGV